ncbi:nucleotidyltransferase domain-containing protein [Nocardia sp. NPDC005366]|uniref:nucleotidyltransferase domain-containing protein n=1 Tax=Nocardia sp. NPDC005366 TaxID=3156878 RepID=UPI00339E81C6
MTRDAVAVAHRLVLEKFPQARAAWLGGSVVTGGATAASDLDITVLLTGDPAPYRESLHRGRWPVEMFVQTETSLMRFCTDEIECRNPTTLRLVGHSEVLVDVDGSGHRLRTLFLRLLDTGPISPTGDEIRAARYGITDLLDDLTASDSDDERLMIASVLATRAGELLLTGYGRWIGRGKWLRREIQSLDERFGSEWAVRLPAAVRAVAAGDIGPMVAASEEILDLFGGRLFEGYRSRAAADVLTER